MAGQGIWQEQGRPKGAAPGTRQATTSLAFGIGRRRKFLSLPAALRTLWRRKLVIAFFAIVATAGTAAATADMPGRYVAHAFIAIGDPLAGNRSGYGDSQSPGLPDASAVQTEIEILRSPKLAIEVIRDLALETHPAFNPAEAASSGWSKAKQWLFGSHAPADHSSNTAIELSRIVHTFLGHLRIGFKDNSRMVDVAFEAADPRLAMQVANGIADRYVNDQLEVRSQSAKRTSAWLEEKIAQLRLKVEDAETAVEHYRAQAGLFPAPREAAPLLERLSDIASQLTAAGTARAELEARLGQLRDASRGDGHGISGIVDSPLMRTLDGQQADTEQKLAETSSSLGERNPATVGLRERLRRIQAAKRIEAQRAVAFLENDLKIAQMRERDLGERLSRLQNETTIQNHAQLQLRVLEREAQADRLMLDNFLTRFKEVSELGEISSQAPSARIVSYAQLPVSPDRSGRRLAIVIAASASLIGAAFAALLAGQIDLRLHTPEDIEDRLGIAPLGVLRSSRAAHISPSEAARYGSSYRESAKETYSRIFRGRTMPNVMVITSALTAEGKTTLALTLAAMASQAGHRVLLVDADLGKRGPVNDLPPHATVGLAGLLGDRIATGDAIRTDPFSGADIMVAGGFSRASRMAAIAKLPALLESLKNRYDLIIVDTAPVLSMPEVPILAGYADTTVMATRAAGTPWPAVRTALKQLQDSDAVVIGAVLTMAGRSSAPKYGYADRRLPGDHRSSPCSRADRSALLLLDVPEPRIGRSRRHQPPGDVLDRLIETINGLTRVASHVDTLVVQARRERSIVARILVGSTTNGSKSDRAAARSASWLEIVPDCSFTRMGADAFSNGALDAALRENGIGHLFVAGVDGATSIRQTALSALKRGYRVSFIRDGIFSASEAKWRRALRIFESAAAFAITSDEFRELAMTAYTASDAERRGPRASRARAGSDAAAAVRRDVKTTGTRTGWHREITLVAASLVLGLAGSWWYASDLSSPETTPSAVLAETPRSDTIGANQQVIDDLRQALDQTRATAERSAIAAAQALEDERARTAALTRDLDAARSETEARMTGASAATAEATQEHERAEALSRELTTARGEMERLRAASVRSEEQVVRLEEEAARAAGAHRQALQQEHEKAEKLARELVAARRALEMEASARASEQTAWNRQLAESRRALEQAQAAATASQEALAQERARNRPPVQESAASISPAVVVAAANDTHPAVPTGRLSSGETGIGLETSHLMTRANLLLNQGDVAAARVVLDHAAETGDARALFALAETYDPLMLSGWGTLGTRGDVAKARELYAKAFSGGVQEAKDRLDALR